MTSDGGRQKNSSFFLPAGFSIIEVVAVLVILGIAGVMGFGIMGNIAGGFLHSRDNVELAQKAQIALERIRIDLIYVDDPASVTIPGGSASTISYSVKAQGEGDGEEISIYLESGGRVYYKKDGSSYLLIDSVKQSGGLAFSRDGNLIGINLVMLGSKNLEIPFFTKVYVKEGGS